MANRSKTHWYLIQQISVIQLSKNSIIFAYHLQHFIFSDFFIKKDVFIEPTIKANRRRLSLIWRRKFVGKYWKKRPFPCVGKGLALFWFRKYAWCTNSAGARSTCKWQQAWLPACIGYAVGLSFFLEIEASIILLALTSLSFYFYNICAVYDRCRGIAPRLCRTASWYLFIDAETLYLLLNRRGFLMVFVYKCLNQELFFIPHLR